jgi:hypothetical protein
MMVLNFDNISLVLKTVFCSHKLFSFFNSSICTLCTGYMFQYEHKQAYFAL